MIFHRILFNGKEINNIKYPVYLLLNIIKIFKVCAMFSSRSLTWGGVVTKSFIRVIYLDQKVYAVYEKSDWFMSTLLPNTIQLQPPSLYNPTVGTINGIFQAKVTRN